jgi:hypothetical protein
MTKSNATGIPIEFLFAVIGAPEVERAWRSISFGRGASISVHTDREAPDISIRLGFDRVLAPARESAIGGVCSSNLHGAAHVRQLLSSDIAS